MASVRYFLGDSHINMREWDEVSEYVYKAVRQNAMLRMDIFKSDSKPDYTKETFFEGCWGLCGVRVEPGDMRLDILFPNARKKCVVDTDGDGNCSNCALRPEYAACRKVVWEELPERIVR